MSDADLQNALQRLPLASDPVLQKALSKYPGLRLLRQPLEETLLCYLCSSTKRIPQIRACCEALAFQLGESLGAGWHALPSWQTLAQADEAALRACGLGYRARFVKATAASIAAEPHFFADLAEMPYAQALGALTALPGVGQKIADCTLLYSGHSLEAFPSDTWILKAMAGAYGLTGWKPEQVAHFGRVHFGRAAGLAQQYLFESARLGTL